MEVSGGSRSRALPWTPTSCSLLNPAHHHHHHFHHQQHPMTQFHHHHHHHFHHQQHPMTQFHHHHHHHHLIFCPQHDHHHHHHHHHRLNSELVGATPLQNLEAQAALLKDATDHGTQMLQEQEYNGFEEAGEDDDEPIFVLTDEWREFFAKSEAKRKLERKQKQVKRK